MGDQETLGRDLSGSVHRTARLEETLTEGQKCEPAEEGGHITYFFFLDTQLTTNKVADTDTEWRRGLF